MCFNDTFCFSVGNFLIWRLYDYSQVTSEEEFINMIVSDARREFVGEGQTFFMYKRLKKNLLGMEGYSWKEVEAKEENMVLPLPDSESNI